MLSSKIFLNNHMHNSGGSTLSVSSIYSNNYHSFQRVRIIPPTPPQRFRVRCQQQQLEVVGESPFFKTTNKYAEEKEEEEGKLEEEEEEGISGIQVPRQKYISVSKSNLLSAILSSIFDESQQDIAIEFTRFSSCLDSILHAEHKTVLEEMRMDYNCPSSTTTHYTGGSKKEGVEASDAAQEEVPIVAAAAPAPATDDGNTTPSLPFSYNLDLGSLLLGSSLNRETRKSSTVVDSSVAVASRFQRAFLKLLQDAQFEELSARDLLLTSALNTDYLLTLPIYVDWKRASESNAIIFRRGYATETQKGLLIGEKLDYLQSKLLQGVFFSLSKPLGKVGMLIKEAFESATQRQDLQIWIEKVKLRLKESFPQLSYSDDEITFDNQSVSEEESASDLPIWLAAQKAVPRYEGLLSSVGPRGRLLRKLLTWTGLIPSTPKTSLELDSDSITSEHYLRSDT